MSEAMPQRLRHGCPGSAAGAALGTLLPHLPAGSPQWLPCPTLPLPLLVPPLLQVGGMSRCPTSPSLPPAARRW